MSDDDFCKNCGITLNYDEYDECDDCKNAREEESALSFSQSQQGYSLELWVDKYGRE